MLFTCEYCNTEFSTKRALKCHKSTAKYCLERQGKQADNFFTCSCGKTFTRKHHLELHEQRCSRQTVVSNNSINSQKNTSTNNLYLNTIIPAELHLKLSAIITQKVAEGGINDITDTIIKNILVCNGKANYYCSDRQRKVFKMLQKTDDGNVNVVVDNQALRLRSILTPLLKVIIKPYIVDEETKHIIANLQIDGKHMIILKDKHEIISDKKLQEYNNDVSYTMKNTLFKEESC
jgi:hypothetical protein